MCTIFHKFNNSVIASMQDDAYRDVMVDFWQTAANRLPGTSMLTTNWDLTNMKTLMQVMFATANDIIFEKATTKVACAQRLVRLSSLFAQYAKHFQERKCLPDGTFVKNYEEREKKKMVDLGSFNGMLAEYTATASGPAYDVKQKPIVTRADQATIAQVAKMHLPEAYNSGWNSGGVNSSSTLTAQELTWLEEQRKKEKHAKDVADNTAALQEIRNYVYGEVQPLVKSWVTNAVNFETARQQVAAIQAGSLSQRRGEIALIIYQQIVALRSTQPPTPYNDDDLFNNVYSAFVVNADNAAWLNDEMSARAAANV
jgi:hypothetical protein